MDIAIIGARGAKQLVEGAVGKRLAHRHSPVAWGRARSDGVNRRHLWHIMFEQGFDAVLQRRGRRRTARAGALHLEIDIALVEAAIEDVDRKSTRLNSSH